MVILSNGLYPLDTSKVRRLIEKMNPKATPRKTSNGLRLSKIAPKQEIPTRLSAPAFGVRRGAQVQRIRDGRVGYVRRVQCGGRHDIWVTYPTQLRSNWYPTKEVYERQSEFIWLMS